MHFDLNNLLPPWAIMWIVALGWFGLFKWLTWCRQALRCPNIGPGNRLGYCFGWVGFDADVFCKRSVANAIPLRNWLTALGSTLMGAGIVWGCVRHLPPDRPALIGAVGFAGIILLLHFGLFHLLALAWRRAGTAVQPIMDRPYFATCLADFWGRRWNRAYRRISFEYFFRPLVRRFGLSAGTLLAFVASGLIHESVISLPAGAGFGGPTAYFAIQGLALLLERAAPMQRVMHNRLCGWCYTALVVVGPSGLLFPSPFLTRVIVPFLEWIGAK